MMLRTLLEDRFGLRVHRETREMPVYELVAGRTTGSLVPAASGEPCSVRTTLAGDGRNNEEVFLGCPMERLADTLTHLVGDRPVLDGTNLSGKYDLRLTAIPSYRVHNPPEPADIDPIAAVGRLGLKMVAKKAPIQIVVIDSLEKPGEN